MYDTFHDVIIYIYICYIYLREVDVEAELVRHGRLQGHPLLIYIYIYMYVYIYIYIYVYIL